MVSEHGLTWAVDGDVDVIELFDGDGACVAARLCLAWEGASLGRCLGLGGADALPLVAHVAFLGLLRLWEVLVDVLDVDEGPSAVVALADVLKPGGLGGIPSCRVEISDGGFDAW